MAWETGTTDEFDRWFDSLGAHEQARVLYGIGLLRAVGPSLSRPYADAVNGSRFPNMKELRVQAAGNPIRIFFAFDPRRVGTLLIGGDKTGDDRFYARMIQQADDLYARHLASLEHDDA